MKILKKIIPEPEKIPRKDPEKILIEDYDWHPLMVDTLRGRMLCINIAWMQLKRAMWEALTE